jgi:hypothetical protein
LVSPLLSNSKVSVSEGLFTTALAECKAFLGMAHSLSVKLLLLAKALGMHFLGVTLIKSQPSHVLLYKHAADNSVVASEDIESLLYIGLPGRVEKLTSLFVVCSFVWVSYFRVSCHLSYFSPMGLPIL